MDTNSPGRPETSIPNTPGRDDQDQMPDTATRRAQDLYIQSLNCIQLLDEIILRDTVIAQRSLDRPGSPSSLLPSGQPSAAEQSPPGNSDDFPPITDWRNLPILDDDFFDGLDSDKGAHSRGSSIYADFCEWMESQSQDKPPREEEGSHSRRSPVDAGFTERRELDGQPAAAEEGAHLTRSSSFDAEFNEWIESQLQSESPREEEGAHLRGSPVDVDFTEGHELDGQPAAAAEEVAHSRRSPVDVDLTEGHELDGQPAAADEGAHSRRSPVDVDLTEGNELDGQPPAPAEEGGESRRVPMDVDSVEGCSTKTLHAEPTTLVDPKKEKRRRENARARELRRRKAMYINELEWKVQSLQTEATAQSAKITTLERDAERLISENSKLKLKLQAMEKKLQSSRAYIQNVKTAIQRHCINKGQHDSSKSTD